MRRLGKSEIKTKPLMFGGNVFGWTVDEAMSFKLLDFFLDAGFNFIDTADVYSRWVAGNKGGESEMIIGKWHKLKKCRHQVAIATKVGMEMGPGQVGLSKKHIIAAVEESLKRLQTDYIDLYQAHKDDPDSSVQETLEAFSQLVNQGKVRVIGASNFSTERLKESLSTSMTRGLPRYQALQPLYNLYDRDGFEGPLEDECVKNQIGVISFFSLASGFLTGKYRTKEDLIHRARGARVEKYLNPRGLRIVDALVKVSSELEVTPAQVALAWVVARPSITAAIASATSLEQLDELVKGSNLKLSAEHLIFLNTVSSEE